MEEDLEHERSKMDKQYGRIRKRIMRNIPIFNDLLQYQFIITFKPQMGAVTRFLLRWAKFDMRIFDVDGVTNFAKAVLDGLRRDIDAVWVDVSRQDLLDEACQWT